MCCNKGIGQVSLTHSAPWRSISRATGRDGLCLSSHTPDSSPPDSTMIGKV